MSKLNVFGLREYSRKDMFEDTTDEIREADRFYIMHEADGVIVDKNKEIAELKAKLAEKDAKILQLEALFENYDRISREIIDNANHQKYKRCRAMAKACAWEQRFWGDGIPAYQRQFQWENRAAKWKKRWLQLAEKFKPNNSTAQRAKETNKCLTTTNRTALSAEQ